MDTFSHGTWNLPRGYYNVTVARAKPSVFERGGGGATLGTDELEILATFSVTNTSLQILVDANTRSSGRIRPEHAEFYAIMEVLDAQVTQGDIVICCTPI